MNDIAKSELYAELGYGPPYEVYEQVVCEAGLSHVNKTRINLAKKPQVDALLAERFLPVCQRGDCQREAQARARRGEPRLPVAAAAPEHCAICGGSVITSAAKALLQAFDAAGWRRLCVVGGTLTAHGRLRRELGERLELRLVDGTANRNSTDAKNDLRWADWVVIWAATPLYHRVSTLYQGQAHCSTVDSRGIEDLLQHLRDRALRAACVR